jgi:hypothetical protein
MPGPFHIGSVTDSQGLEICNEAYLTVGSESGEEEDDCEIRIHGAHAHEIARLIAAAPDLLEALKVARQWMPVTAIEATAAQDIAIVEAAYAKAAGLHSSAMREVKP